MSSTAPPPRCHAGSSVTTSFLYLLGTPSTSPPYASITLLAFTLMPAAYGTLFLGGGLYVNATPSITRTGSTYSPQYSPSHKSL